MADRWWWGLALALLVPSSAAAQSGTAAAAGAPAVAAASDEATAAREQARQHFENGVSLMHNEDWNAALLEFQRSLELYPTRNALFNLGMCQKALFHYVAAMETFRQFLAQYRDQADAEQLASLDQALDELQRLRARIRITVNVAGADVLIDGRSVGTSPLAAPVVVDPGRHTVEARRDGYAGTSQVVPAASGEDAVADLALVEIARVGRLRVEANVAEAEVRIDGVPVGTVPCRAELAEGEHRIEVRAPGYASETQTVAIATGDERIVTVSLAHPEGTDPAWFWTMVGVTGAAAVSVTALGTVALLKDQDYASDPDRTAAQQEEGRRLVVATDVCLGIAAASAVAALILGLTTDWSGEASGAEAPGPAVAPAVGLADGGAGLVLLGRF